MCYIDIDDPADVFNPVPRTARKQHKCGTCRHPIAPGQAYLHTTTIHEGHISVAKACAVCAALWQDFFKSHNGGYASDMLVDMLQDCIETFYRTKQPPATRRAWIKGLGESERKWRDYLAIVLNRRRTARKEAT